ncbi:hypothetical protein [Paraburkholderia solisilvae]|uniref:Lipoprotein n=1 Tax=Paraburkholderia solisilvae TaxID=624376 RepID=A0A6J5DVP6_9BURK|nr:hypothetical protein [Paraburkholderia solisilvae]CAB3758330.1 hypothetical protein LMG29739_02909 [Paraburkholderia solisilvae]
MKMTRLVRTVCVLVALGATALTVTACGDMSGSGGASSGGSSSSSGGY